LALLEAQQLFIGVDVQPELAQRAAVLHEHLFEVANLFVSAHPFGGRGISLDALDEHASVPTAVKNQHASSARVLLPEAPPVVVTLLFFGRRGDGHNLVIASIHATGESANRAALSCGIPSLKCEDAGAALLARRECEFAEARLQRIQALAVFALGHAL